MLPHKVFLIISFWFVRVVSCFDAVREPFDFMGLSVAVGAFFWFFK